MNWTGSDTDGDNLTYVVLISADNGSNYTTLALDTNATSLIIDNSILENGSKYKIKVLATDGVRTTGVVSNSTFSIQPSPNVDLIYPEDATTIMENDITFRYRTYVLNANIVNCSLFINGVLNLTNSSGIIQNEIMNFTQTLADGDYNWSIRCVDTRGFIGESELHTFSSRLIVPKIKKVIAYPIAQAFGENVSIEAVLNEPNSVDTVILNVTNPGGLQNSYKLLNSSNDTWKLNNFTSYINGTYNFTFFVNYTNGAEVEESGTFDMLVNLLAHCTGLNITGIVYSIIKDIQTNGTCFTIAASNITLDGKGYTIAGNLIPESYSGYGVYISSKDKTTIKNLTIGNFDYGIYFVSVAAYSLKIQDVSSIGNDEEGIHIQQGENHILSSINASYNKKKGIYLPSVRTVNLTNIQANNNWNEGIKIYPYSVYGSESFNLVNVTTSNNGWSGCYVQSANNVVVDNIIAKNNDAGIEINGGSNNTLRNGNLSSVELYSSSKNNTFLNISYSGESVDSTSQLIRKWYLNAQVNYTNGTIANQANVTGKNVSGDVQFSELTNSSGKIATKELIEYINHGGNKTYYTNYTITAVKGDYSALQLLNLNTNKNIFLALRLPPNDTSKVYVRNSSENIVAWLGNLGNIVLAGGCYNSSFNASDDDFTIRNSSGSVKAYIDNSGNIFISDGACQQAEYSSNCSPAGDAFVIQNSSYANVSYTDFNGKLCLKGGLYEFSNNSILGN